MICSTNNFYGSYSFDSHKSFVISLIIIFGFFFVTVSSRIFGLIGASSNPISGMNIATLMATALIFVGVGWTGNFYQPVSLEVGSINCIAAVMELSGVRSLPFAVVPIFRYQLAHQYLLAD